MKLVCHTMHIQKKGKKKINSDSNANADSDPESQFDYNFTICKNYENYYN